MVKQKLGLNRAILDLYWFEFKRQLEYKSAWLGGFLQVIPPQNTSRTCSYCGYIGKENHQTRANFECIEYGYSENVNVVGAMNILNRGREIHL